MNQALVLASSSKYRATLLKRLSIPFQAVSPDIDETPLAQEQPKQLVSRLSMEKAQALSKQFPQATLIGSDQVCVAGADICGKPITAERAVEQLQSFSNSCITFFTGLCVLAPGQCLTHVDATKVTFRNLERAELERYVDKEQPLDCAGSFKVEGLGVSLFEQISSDDPTALMGLPMIKMCEFLRQLGYQLP
ncbi:Maf family protein [Marinicella sp. S1101]|uniref:Maf family protein n=1 Tax=Marinicella marina TaxID=2996016 RepID=UPI002260B683|nr:nucleoside triphosphate pyrophosphatase [Marinicella marina]MCX7554536.1 Maf family protein [Marinicella marina]MDJ1141080.1 nucleoside triphosphate pyrophosphatase [Marinicella marina]